MSIISVGLVLFYIHAAAACYGNLTDIRLIQHVRKPCVFGKPLTLKVNGETLPCQYQISRKDVRDKLTVSFPDAVEWKDYVLLIFTYDHPKSNGNVLSPYLTKTLYTLKGRYSREGETYLYDFLLPEPIQNKHFVHYRFLLLEEQPGFFQEPWEIPDTKDFLCESGLLNLWGYIENYRLCIVAAVSGLTVTDL